MGKKTMIRVYNSQGGKHIWIEKHTAAPKPTCMMLSVEQATGLRDMLSKAIAAAPQLIERASKKLRPNEVEGECYFCGTKFDGVFCCLEGAADKKKKPC